MAPSQVSFLAPVTRRCTAAGKTLRSRAAAAPKVHVIDSGVAARLLRVSAAKLASLDPTALAEFGHLLETFVVGELRKQASWLDEQVSTGHWRTHGGDEVDYVIEFDDGQVLAFEVKANESREPTSKAFAPYATFSATGSSPG